jgi:hypothetical protein
MLRGKILQKTSYCYHRVVKLCKNLDIMIREIMYFVNSEFKFDDKHLQALIMTQSDKDKKLFAFDLSGMEWETYLMKSISGSRKYVLKDSDDTTESQKRYQK